MAKKIQPKTLGEAYKGTILTFIVTLFILGVGFFLPMITANQLEKARDGKGFYKPKEEMIWDIESISDLANLNMIHKQNTGILRGYYPHGEKLPTYASPYEQANIASGIFWQYKSYNSNSNQYQGSVYPLTLHVIDLDTHHKVIDEYVQTSLTDSTTIGGHQNTHFTGTPTSYHRPEHIYVYLDIDITDWIEKDVTRFSFYLDVEMGSGAEEFIRYVCKVYSLESGRKHEIGRDFYTIGTTENITINIDDLIGIINLASDDLVIELDFYIVLDTGSSDKNNEFKTFGNLVFDAQVFGLQGKTNAITILSVWYVVQSILIFMLGIVMIPQISIGGLSKILRLNKEW